MEAFTSFNWFLLSGEDFKVENWFGGGTLDYAWTEQDDGNYVSKEWDLDEDSSSSVINTSSSFLSYSWLSLAFNNNP